MTKKSGYVYLSMTPQTAEALLLEHMDQLHREARLLRSEWTEYVATEPVIPSALDTARDAAIRRTNKSILAEETIVLIREEATRKIAVMDHMKKQFEDKLCEFEARLTDLNALYQESDGLTYQYNEQTP